MEKTWTCHAARKSLEKNSSLESLCVNCYTADALMFQALENGLSLVLESIQSFVLLYLQISRIVTFLVGRFRSLRDPAVDCCTPTCFLHDKNGKGSDEMCM